MDHQEREEQGVKREIRQDLRTFTEKECRSRLRKQRWPKGFECPKCGKSKKYYKKQRKLYQCKKCGHQTSVTSGDNFFNGTKIPLKTWFVMIALVFEKRWSKIPRSELQKMLKIKSPISLYRMKEKIEEALKDRKLSDKLIELIED
jgi:predicted RNA-binding Zn-ribbon protein involved in translation (DUF1610 family)